MSAILFNPEQQLNSDISNQLFDDDISPAEPPTSTCTNGGDNTAVTQRDDVCEELLGNKMTALELNERENALQRQQQQPNNYDGSDSGVDITTTSANVTLQRALSSNSGGYASSSNGCMDDTTTHGLNMSCDSSMISCSSDMYELKTSNVVVLRSVNTYDCCSENGSENSSVTGSTAVVRRSNSIKKKVALFEPPPPPSMSRGGKEVTPQLYGIVSQSRPRLSGIKRTSSLTRPGQILSTMPTRERINEKQMPNSGKPVLSSTMTNSFRATQVRASQKPQKPDSLPSALNRTQSISMQRLAQRTPSLSRARTPGTPTDDGRWPGVSNTRSVAPSTGNFAKRGLSVTPDLMSSKMRTSMLASMETRQSTVNPYSTLPRRRKQKSVEDLTGCDSRCSSITRESRMTSSVVINSRRNLVSSYGSAASTPTQTKMLPPSSTSVSVSGRSLSARKTQQPTKTRIYHETSVQTALTSDDIDKAFAGDVAAARPVDAAEQRDQQTQSDIRDRELERLRDEVRHLAQREHELSAKLQREREEKLMMQRELHLNTERVMGMLEMARVVSGGKGGEVGDSTPTSDDGGHDSLLMLESQIQMSGYELVERQQEIGQLRLLCRSLQLEMQRSLAAQECLLQEKAAIEQESSELQDFLQHEKAAMCDAFKELETEYHSCKQELSSRDEEVKVLRDECRHLVRLNEQRRQENRMLQTKYAALESKSKELIMQQNFSVSGASTALSGLHTRLDSLVEQLVSTYNITEHDLEDLGFQNETQTNIDGTNECENQIVKSLPNGLDISLHQLHPSQQLMLAQASDGSLSPQRNQSFIAAVISAIRNATTPSSKKLLARNGNGKQRISSQESNHNNNNNTHQNHHDEQQAVINNGDDSDSTEMLDSETEPCLMMDNVLEDVTMPDSHSHNMVSSCTGMISQIDIPSELINVTTGDESLHNLSQAIANRQQMELQISALSVQKSSLPMNQRDTSNCEDSSCHDSVAEMPSLMEYCTAQAVVDQVIEVDSLVTKLLKVLRLIQMDNDNCIQQLIIDKNKLQQNKEDMLEKLKDLQDDNMKLQDELMDATQELMLKNNDLSNTKAEMQRHRNEIDVRY